MLARIALYVLMAVGLAGFGAVAWISLHPPGATQQAADAPQPAGDRISVLAAARPLRGEPAEARRPGGAGDVAQRHSGRCIARYAGGASGPPRRHDPAQSDGGRDRAASRRAASGRPWFSAAVLASGMRAVTVGVDAITGIAGLIWPGDRVDLILTQTQDDSTVTPAAAFPARRYRTTSG